MEDNRVRCQFEDCKSYDIVKNGKVMHGQVQRYKCLTCQRSFTLLASKKHCFSEREQILAYFLYVCGVRQSLIARRLQVTHTTVKRWINKVNNGLRLKEVERPLPKTRTTLSFGSISVKFSPKRSEK